MFEQKHTAKMFQQRGLPTDRESFIMFVTMNYKDLRCCTKDGVYYLRCVDGRDHDICMLGEHFGVLTPDHVEFMYKMNEELAQSILGYHNFKNVL